MAGSYEIKPMHNRMFFETVSSEYLAAIGKIKKNERDFKFGLGELGKVILYKRFCVNCF